MGPAHMVILSYHPAKPKAYSVEPSLLGDWYVLYCLKGKTNLKHIKVAMRRILHAMSRTCCFIILHRGAGAEWAENSIISGGRRGGGASLATLVGTCKVAATPQQHPDGYRYNNIVLYVRR